MFYFDKRLLYLLLIIMFFTGLSSFDPLSILLTLPGVLIAITFHEFAHGYAAYKLGDDTAASQGRLTLNPLHHIDPIGLFLLIFAGFGWGKPVTINTNNFNKKYSRSASEAIVAVAGPVMNFILAIIFSIIYGLIIKFLGVTFLKSTTGIVMLTIVQATVTINIGLGVFNLIPLPPLDGSKVLMHFLNYETKRKLEDYQEFFYIIFLVLWGFGILGNLITPVIRFIYMWIMKIPSLFL